MHNRYIDIHFLKQFSQESGSVGCLGFFNFEAAILIFFFRFWCSEMILDNTQWCLLVL